MVAKKFVLALCAIGFLQTSFAGFERFWLFSKDANSQIDSWESMSEAEQIAAVKRYQSLKELPQEQSSHLQQRIDWFTQLPEQDKQKMRDAWQKMSSNERRELGQRLDKARPEQRNAIREEYIAKYSQSQTNIQP